MVRGLSRRKLVPDYTAGLMADAVANQFPVADRTLGS